MFWKKSIKYHVLSIKGLFRLFVFLSLTTYYILHTTSAFAQTPLPPTVSPTSPLYTDLLVYNMFHTFSCLSVGQSVIGQPCLTYQLTQNAQGAIQGVPVLSSANLSGGLLGTTTGLIAGLYMNPPVRTADYLASLGEGFGVVKEAHAQVVGSGAAVLSPIISLWQVSRNISYLVMIIIFVVIGLMVMFRNRINPQTVITAQAALPGLVIGVILITFSYFLAALITDVAFVGTDLVGYYFAQVPGVSPQNNQSLAQRISDENAISIFSNLINKQQGDDFDSAAKTVVDNLSSSSPTDLFSPINIIKAMATFINQQYMQLFAPATAGIAGALCLGVPLITTAIGAAAGAPAGGVGAAPGAAAGAGLGGVLAAGLTKLGVCGQAGNVAGNALGQITALGRGLLDPAGSIGLGLFIIAIIFLVVAMIKLLVRLLQNYISIIFLTITAPFIFLAAALPGRQGLATNWILNMLANILAFPAVLAVFYFVAYILGTDVNGAFGINQPVAITGPQTLPLFGGLSLSIIKTLIGFVALIATPAVPDIIARIIGSVGAAGELIGREYGAISGQGQGYLGRAQAGMGEVSRGIGGLGQFGTTRIPMLNERGQIIGWQTSPGLWGRATAWRGWEMVGGAGGGGTTPSPIKGS